jgi:hypothetical protein
MNCQDAKKIDIVAFLQMIGFEGKLKYSYMWYNSPFRNEKTASFRVDIRENRWIDFGTSDMKKGDLVDLVKLIYNTDTKGALNILCSYDPNQFLSFSKAYITSHSTEPGIKINHTQPIENKALVQYINERGIPLRIAKLYTKEVYYSVNDKRFFSIGFKNDKEGFELRNKYFKNCSSPKHVTTFKAVESNDLNLFEGFFDFLSALVYYKVEKMPQNVIVLNSLSNLYLVLTELSKYEKVSLFLDNDQAGREAVQIIKAAHSSVSDESAGIFPNHKDFNQFIVNRGNIV